VRALRELGQKVKLVTTSACLALALFARGERVRACSGMGEAWGIMFDTTFDPGVVGEWAGLGWDPWVPTFGGACGDCIDKARSADWTGYLPGVTAADWKKILDGATDSELLAMKRGSTSSPKKFAASSVWKVADKPRLAAAFEYVRLARKLEPHLTLETNYQGAPTPPPPELLTLARDGISNRDPFLAQRYAYQAMRAAFYRTEWPVVIKLHDDHAAVLAGPSTDLKWDAEHYLAGALIRSGKRGRANLELARIAMAYEPLAGQAVFEFSPKDEADWKEALRLAKTTADKVALWRVVGIRKDGLVGAREVLALDPKSPFAALLIVRELTKIEGRAMDRWSSDPPDPVAVAAQQKEYGALEKFALDQLAKRGDRPYLWELISGHIAALRGDLSVARARMGRAVAAQPTNARVVSQANASLALAVSRTYKVDASLEAELATLWGKIGYVFNRGHAVDEIVRRRLAPLYLKAGQPAVAELLRKGTVDPDGTPPTKLKWRDLSFIRELMRRETTPKTPFEKLVASGTYTKDELQFEIAMRLLFDGDFAGAQAAYDNKRSQKLSQDPFVLKIRDTYDADRAKYRGTATYASLIARLVELDVKVKAGGEAGAEAAMLIGNAIYNSTYTGVSKWMIEGSHAGGAADAELAMRYFKKAHDLSNDRETKTRAAVFAAKAEMIMRIAEPAAASATPDPDEASPPMPKTWYPILKTYKGTRYYNEVIKECGRFASWAK